MANAITSVTFLECQLIRNIAENDFAPLNGGKPETFNECGCVWSNCLDAGPCSIDLKRIPGIMSSLVKKELAWSSGEGSDSKAGLTELGFSIYKQLP